MEKWECVVPGLGGWWRFGRSVGDLGDVTTYRDGLRCLFLWFFLFAATCVFVSHEQNFAIGSESWLVEVGG